MSTGEQTACVNPATGEVLGYSPINTAEEAKEAVERARAAQPGWQATPVERAARVLDAGARLSGIPYGRLAEIISKDNGKTRLDALMTEILPAAMAVSYYARKAKSFLKDKHPFPANLLLANKLSRIRRVPYGVISIISPWNYPFGIPFSEVIMGLLAGNAVILKAATDTATRGTHWTLLSGRRITRRYLYASQSAWRRSRRCLFAGRRKQTLFHRLGGRGQKTHGQSSGKPHTALFGAGRQ